MDSGVSTHEPAQGEAGVVHLLHVLLGGRGGGLEPLLVESGALEGGVIGGKTAVVDRAVRGRAERPKGTKLICGRVSLSEVSSKGFSVLVVSPIET